MTSKLHQIQLGIFYTYDRPDYLARALSDTFLNEFDTPIINLPIPASIVDFPSTQMESSSKLWQARFSKKRADIFFTPKINNDLSLEDLNSKIDILDSMFFKLVEYLDSKSVTIERVTNVNYFVIEWVNSAEYVQRKFFKEELINNEINEVLLKFNHPVMINNVRYNNLTQYENAKIVDDSGNESELSLYVTRDFNSDPLQKTSFSHADVEQFISLAKTHARQLTWF